MIEAVGIRAGFVSMLKMQGWDKATVVVLSSISGNSIHRTAIITGASNTVAPALRRLDMAKGVRFIFK